jgi:hypothetical protein
LNAAAELRLDVDSANSLGHIRVAPDPDLHAARGPPPGLHATIYVAVNLLLIAVWAVTGRGYFWPIWPILGWGAALRLHYWTVFLRRPISEDEIRREMEKGP